MSKNHFLPNYQINKDCLPYKTTSFTNQGKIKSILFKKLFLANRISWR